MHSKNKIVISKDFSLYPIGRTDRDGENHGQRFYKEFLAEVLKTGTQTEIVLDGCKSMGSSFLDEALYEMPLKDNFKRNHVQLTLKIIALDPEYQFYKKMAETFIRKLPV